MIGDGVAIGERTAIRRIETKRKPVDRRQVRAPEGAGKADQKQRAVAQAGQISRARSVRRLAAPVAWGCCEYRCNVLRGTGCFERNGTPQRR